MDAEGSQGRSVPGVRGAISSRMVSESSLLEGHFSRNVRKCVSKPCDHLRGKESRGRRARAQVLRPQDAWHVRGASLDQCGSEAVSEGGNDGGSGEKAAKRPDYGAFWTV